MSFVKPTTGGVSTVESPLYGHDGDFLTDNEEQQEETDSQHDTDTEGEEY